MQMEENTYEELAARVADVMQRVKLFSVTMEDDFNVRVRQLFIESLGAQVAAMTQNVNTMTLLMIQCKDAGFTECKKQTEQTLRQMNSASADTLPEKTSVFEMPSDEALRGAMKLHTDNITGDGTKPATWVNGEDLMKSISLDIDSIADTGAGDTTYALNSGNPPDPVGAAKLAEMRAKTQRLGATLDSMGVKSEDLLPPVLPTYAKGGVLNPYDPSATYEDRIARTKARLKGLQSKLEAHAPAVDDGVSSTAVTGMDEVAGLVTTEGHRIVQDGEASFHTEPTERVIDEMAHAVAEEGYVIHKLKIWPEWFNDVYSELKTFEVRLNDRGFKTGDYLDLREFNPDTKMYTGRRVLREICYCVNLEPLGLTDHVALGIVKVKPVKG